MVAEGHGGWWKMVVEVGHRGLWRVMEGSGKNQGFMLISNLHSSNVIG